jgi:hypothetical protein
MDNNAQMVNEARSANVIKKVFYFLLLGLGGLSYNMQTIVAVKTRSLEKCGGLCCANRKQGHTTKEGTSSD